MKRRLPALLLTLALLFSLSVPALAAGAPSVQLNGESVSLTPVLWDRRAYLPYDQLFAALDAQAEYDPAAGLVTARRDGVELSLPAAWETEGAAYVSVRAGAEALGFNVGWDRETRTVLLVDAARLAAGALAGADYSVLAGLEGAGTALASGSAPVKGLDGAHPLASLLSALPLTDGEHAWPMVTAVLDGLSDQALAAGEPLRVEAGGTALSVRLTTEAAGYALRMEAGVPLSGYASPAALSRLGLNGETARLELELTGRAATASAAAGRLTAWADWSPAA